MKENSKLIIALSVFLLISIIILPSIIGGRGEVVSSKELDSNDEPDAEVISASEIFMYTTDHLNMRTGPGTDYEIITTIQAGEGVQVLENLEGWVKVEYENQTGYCSFKYLKESPIN